MFNNGSEIVDKLNSDTENITSENTSLKQSVFQLKSENARLKAKLTSTGVQLERITSDYDFTLMQLKAATEDLSTAKHDIVTMAQSNGSGEPTIAGLIRCNHDQKENKVSAENFKPKVEEPKHAMKTCLTLMSVMDKIASTPFPYQNLAREA